tara:strand:+ start:1671 stop:2549 length:879 start_codon:yes stop_codon:yes gene_type:complete
MSKDLLREAIADAKAVRETAIANAKLALEEAFTPKLQSMLSTKIAEEMDDELEEDEELEMDAAEVEEPVAEMEDEELPAEESYTEEAEEDEVYSEDEEEGEEEDLELESIIRELEADEEELEEEVADEEEEAVTENEDETELEEDEEEMDLEEIIRSLSENDDEEELEEEEEVEAELEEAYNTIRSLKNTINEVNLLNSKLLFSNKLFRMHSLSESQKMNVIETFDRASSVREVKLVYTTLAESLVPATSSRKRTVTEGFASKSTRSTKPSKNVIVESNNFAKRMQTLAGLK